jgi:hypothetical protein
MCTYWRFWERTNADNVGADLWLIQNSTKRLIQDEAAGHVTVI